MGTACGYDVTFNDCEVRCQGSNDCPDGFSCQESLCRVAGMSGACGTPGTMTLRQTSDDKIDSNLVFACTNADQTTADTSWYRIFSLDEAGISGTFTIDKVTLGVAKSVGTPSASVKVGVYLGQFPAGALDPAQITMATSASVPIPASGIATSVAIPITAAIPAGSKIAVEVDIADQTGTGNQVDIGSSDSAQTHPAYIRTPKCGNNSPITTVTAGLPNAAFVLTVEGAGG